MTVTTRAELRLALRSGHSVDLISRAENAVTRRLSDVIVTEVSERDVSVRTLHGVERVIPLDSLVNTDGERRRRKRWRRVGWLTPLF